MNLVNVSHPRNTLYAISKSATSNYMYLLWKFSQVPKVIRKVI
jgi:hypothetical protein